MASIRLPDRWRTGPEHRSRFQGRTLHISRLSSTLLEPGLVTAALDLLKACVDQRPHQRLRKRMLRGEVKRALRSGIAVKLGCERRERGAAEWQVAQVLSANAAKPATTMPSTRNAGIR
jgi:hypothetical protein